MDSTTLNIIYKAMLYLHIAAGAIALLSGLVPFFTPKGNKLHKRTGKIFYWAMMLISFTAVFIALYKDIKFLLAISVFSFYMNYTGYRVLKYKRGRFKWFDWIPLVVSTFAVVYMFYTMNIILVVFGALLTLLIVQDIRKQFKSEEDLKIIAKEKVIDHLGRMSGTYIATFTAFLVVNINFVKPGWIVWLLPTAVGVPFIVYYTNVWRKKLGLK